ncbi:Zn-finger in Ran binding protein [Musa troglodytarum]|uniref:Zn-finger in Ran binding protein n=1 Tax=Musa troglodytarum TaxID=320322 RepID=A0A9E7JZ24_9LILI|nr:Zn-finger in Ran binding protein [Musa troglodytarum]
MSSTKVADRGSVGSKRPRSEGFRRDGDWTCPQCGNVNFSFRTVCNRGSCGAARPSASPSPITRTTPVPGTFDHPGPSYYGDVGGPPPMRFGMLSGYPSSLTLHQMRYSYGPPSGAPGPYSLLSPYGPPGPLGVYGYGPGPVMDGYGGPGPVMDGYGGPGPIMDRYDYGYQGSPMPTSGPASRELFDNSTLRKRRGGPDGLLEGDWICPKCENVNFAFRTTCNMKKCGTPKPTTAPNRDSKDVSDAPEGSWTCGKCNNLNYPFRNVCNRKGCENEKPSSTSSK